MTNKKIGRPKKNIDWNQFDKLCILQCTLSEIAGFFEMSEDSVERRVKEEYFCSFAEYYKYKSSQGKISLRRYQMKMAEKNAAMGIWLGKQMLDQKDKQEIDQNINQNVTEIKRYIVRADDNAKD